MNQAFTFYGTNTNDEYQYCLGTILINRCINIDRHYIDLCSLVAHISRFDQMTDD